MISNEFSAGLDMAIIGRSFSAKLPDGHVKRDDLISALLQERNSLRVISAPFGFGKSTLAHEYAARLFAGGAVAWIDASQPDFLMALDGEQSPRQGSDIAPELIIIDDLPWLHEQRARTFSHRIDSVLYGGAEVIVTTLPSCDCLGTLQPDRLLIRAEDLLVSERECFLSQPVNGAEGKARATRQWREANEVLFGRAPAVMWSQNAGAQRACLSALFSEGLPQAVIRGMFAMLLLEEGELDNLDDLDIKLHDEDIAMLIRDYPIFGIDSVMGDFDVKAFELTDLKRAVADNKLGSSLMTGNFPLVEKVLAMLFDRGNSKRGVEALDLFCSDERCANWLEARGWELLDRGEISLAANLLERCPEALYAKRPGLQAFHAWLSGLSGDSREACHLALRVLERSENREEAGEEPDAPGLMARLALAMFDRDALMYKGSAKFASANFPSNETDFLAAVVDSCSVVEIARAFHLESDADDTPYEKRRRSPSKQRVRAMLGMYSEYCQRFRSSQAFLLALHMLAYIDSTRLHRQLQELGVDFVVEMRRSGVSTFTQALLVRDLWQTGYFGLVGPVMDRRDVKVLDGASHMLGILAQCCGYGSIDVPWEMHSTHVTASGAPSNVMFIEESIETMHVRLFGGLEVTVGERYVTESRWRKKARALFTLLVLNMGRDVPRDELFGQIWPDMSHVHALDNFYTLWSNCTSAVGESPYLERNGEFCRVDPRFVKSDVAEFEQLTRHLLTSDRDPNYLLDTYAKIEAIYHGSLVPSETEVEAINIQRERYRALFVDAMVAAAECAMRAGDLRIALWFARKAMEEDQEREDVYRVLMKAQITAGQRCPAIKTYLKCRDFLQSTLGLDPSLETRQLYEGLVTNDPGLLRLDSSSFSR